MLCAQAGGLNDAKSPFEVAPGVRFAGPGDRERSASESFPKYVFGAVHLGRIARTTVVSQINFDKQTCFSLGTFPSLQRRGGCGINQKSRSHRRGADGVVAHTTRFTNAFRSIACERPPRPRLFSERIHFANGASTPPLQGGECTYPKSVSNTLVRSVMLAECMASRAAKRNPSSQNHYKYLSW